MTDKGKIKELNQRIDEILYYEWDPIGVSDEPCARAEYSSYTMTILKYVLEEDLHQIANQLSKIETASMGKKYAAYILDTFRYLKIEIYEI